MATIQIKHVPESARVLLHRRSDHARQSLQEFVLTQLEGGTVTADPRATLDMLDDQVTAAIDYDKLNEIIRADRSSH